jgi:DNA-binding transcriptional MerR regulator
MVKELSIGAVARRTGLSVKTIRFYELAGYVPASRRSESGYRRYTEADVRRLSLLRQLRHLGLPLAQAQPLLQQALSQDCADFAADLSGVFVQQRHAIEARIAELEDLRGEIDRLAEHVAHCECAPGQTLADWDYCSLLDGEGDDPDE